MKKCRSCGKDVSEDALMCPYCGAPYPAQEEWNGWGIEYKSKMKILGLPLLHISFKYRPNFMPVPAKGIISIGQFGIGIINISQFGIGFINIAQFGIGYYLLSQIGFGYKIIAQIGFFISSGKGQIVKNIIDVLK